MGSLPTSPWRMIAIDVFWEPAQRCASSLRYFHGFPSQYVMINGKFDQPDDLPGRQMVEGKYTLAPLYHVKVSSWVYLFKYSYRNGSSWSILSVEPRHGNFCGSSFWREDASDYGQKPALRGENTELIDPGQTKYELTL